MTFNKAITAAYEWGVVCTTYYAYLKQYIAVENRRGQARSD